MAADLGEVIQEMQQGPLGQRRATVENRGPGAGKQLGRRRQRQIGRYQQSGRRPHLEDMGQVGLAAAGRAVHCQSGSGPIWPAIEPGDRRLIAGSDQEVLAAEGGAMA